MFFYIFHILFYHFELDTFLYKYFKTILEYFRIVKRIKTIYNWILRNFVFFS